MTQVTLWMAQGHCQDNPGSIMDGPKISQDASGNFKDGPGVSPR